MNNVLATKSPLFMKEMGRITQVVENYMRTGIAILEDDYSRKGAGDMIAPMICMRKFIRQIAKEQKRPFVYIEAAKYTDGTRQAKLVLPRIKSLANLYSSLLLAMPEAKTPLWSVRKAVPFWRQSNTTSLVFYFNDSGRELLEAWLEKARTDPVFRITMKLPPRNEGGVTNARVQDGAAG